MAPTVSSYGSWVSPITIDSVVSEQRTISSPRASSITGRHFFVESRQSGHTIVEATASGCRDVLPPECSVESRVYEYGGSLYGILPDSRIIFSNKDDTVRIPDADTQQVSLLVEKEGFRYSSFNANVTSPWVLAIEEDHTYDTPCDAVHCIVAIDVTTAEVKKIVTGADFYYSPVFSVDGTSLAWLEWNHPGLPFDAAKVHTANWDASGSVSDCRLISGDKCSSVTEPRWGYDGTLLFAQETGGYRQLFRVSPESHTPALLRLKGLEKAEFGVNRRTYAPLSEKHLLAAVAVKAMQKLIAINLETGHWQEASKAQLICEVNWDAMTRLTESTALVVGKGMSAAETLYKIKIQRPECSEVIRKLIDDDGFEGVYSTPETLCIPSKGSPEDLWISVDAI